MRPLEIKKDVFWVGAVDWSGRDFHGYSFSPLGTTYNSYLVKDEKTVLFDTVKAEFKDQFLCALAQALGEAKVDYIVASHLEPDHSGCLPDLVEALKPEKIFCSPMGEKAMKAHFHYRDWPVEVVQSGSELSIGRRSLRFLETRMLHWPDSMFTYIPEDELLISNDAFGQNWATSERFADQVDTSTLKRAMTEYYANIVLPFSSVVLKTLDQVRDLGLRVDMLCPDHGLMFRGPDVAMALDAYRDFALQRPEKKAVIVFDTMWRSTEKMALALADGLADEGVGVRVMSLKANHHSAVMTEVMTAAAVAVGSPTHNNGVLPLVAGMLTYMKGLRPRNKLAAAFGSFGWSGESVKVITEWLESMRMDVVGPGLKVRHVPEHR
ncbi:MAG: flavodoxin domain-containing protein, partial [Desulfovibrionaceae bacterium]|nr:flavodoxin domain-containing protein [Desulfovibrionaceae bacterium]